MVRPGKFAGVENGHEPFQRGSHIIYRDRNALGRQQIVPVSEGGFDENLEYPFYGFIILNRPLGHAHEQVMDVVVLHGYTFPDSTRREDFSKSPFLNLNRKYHRVLSAFAVQSLISIHFAFMKGNFSIPMKKDPG